MTAAVVAAVSLMTAAGCSEDNEGDTPVDQPSAMSSTAPDGERLCDFLPRESAALALGDDGVTAQGGQVSRDSQGTLVGAACRVSVGEDADVALAVMVDYMMGAARGGFEDGIADSERYNQLPDDQGLGYSWVDDGIGEARLSRGDYLIEVTVSGGAEGRDPEADAVALAQQVTATLEIPDEWTLPDTPPSR